MPRPAAEIKKQSTEQKTKDLKELKAKNFFKQTTNPPKIGHPEQSIPLQDLSFLAHIEPNTP